MPRAVASAPHVGSPSPTSCSTAWLPTKRSPLPRSKHRKCVQQSSQLIGAQRKKICGSVCSGAAGVGSPTGRTPHDRSFVP